jgi:putative transposase
VDRIPDERLETRGAEDVRRDDVLDRSSADRHVGSLPGAMDQRAGLCNRQRCCVHRARNLYAKLPERERERVKQAYWQALDDAICESDAKHRLQALVDELDQGRFTAAARCLADDLDALVVDLRYPPRHRRRWRSTNLLERSLGEVKRRTK